MDHGEVEWEGVFQNNACKEMAQYVKNGETFRHVRVMGGAAQVKKQTTVVWWHERENARSVLVMFS